jgi:pimeloyl-ACP methyl ester carboxylesterase
VGTGPHLCFLHGFCENSSIWSELIKPLSADYTCIAIDLPGFGKSNNSSFSSLTEIAEIVNELLKFEKAEECILFGHSMGGYIAVSYLEKYAQQLQGVAFVHSTIMDDQLSKKENRQKSIKFIKKHGTDEFFRLFIPGLVALKHRSRLRDKLTQMVSSTPTSSIINGLTAMMNRPSGLESISNFKKPILFLKGKEDTHYDTAEIYKQASAGSIVQLSVIPEVGHLSMLEDKKKCLTEVTHFLNYVKAFK